MRAGREWREGGKERENCHKLTTVSNVYSRVFLQNHFSVFLYLG